MRNGDTSALFVVVELYWNLVRDYVAHRFQKSVGNPISSRQKLLETSLFYSNALVASELKLATNLLMRRIIFPCASLTSAESCLSFTDYDLIFGLASWKFQFTSSGELLVYYLNKFVLENAQQNNAQQATRYDTKN